MTLELPALAPRYQWGLMIIWKLPSTNIECHQVSILEKSPWSILVSSSSNAWWRKPHQPCYFTWYWCLGLARDHRSSGVLQQAVLWGSWCASLLWCSNFSCPLAWCNWPSNNLYHTRQDDNSSCTHFCARYFFVLLEVNSPFTKSFMTERTPAWDRIAVLNHEAWT